MRDIRTDRDALRESVTAGAVLEFLVQAQVGATEGSRRCGSLRNGEGPDHRWFFSMVPPEEGRLRM